MCVFSTVCDIGNITIEADGKGAMKMAIEG